VQFVPDAYQRSVYAGKRITGFEIYDVQKTKGKAQGASIYRFMIYRKHQGKGYCRAAMREALEKIRMIPWLNSILFRYMPENPVAKPFYVSFCFVKVGREHDGGLIAVLKL
jgi:diamine N-acetyltransferase